MTDERLNYRVYNTEYAYIIAFVKTVTEEDYEDLVKRILEFRSNNDDTIISLLKKDEHTYVNCIYEWQYYTQKLLKTIGILKINEGEKNCKLFHPQKKQQESSNREMG